MINGKISQLNNKNGETMFPITSSSAVMMKDGVTTVEDKIDDFNSQLNHIVHFQPTGLDDTVLLQNLINNDKVIRLSDKTYKIRTLNLKPSTRIIGSGMHKTIIEYLDTNGKAFNIVDCPKFQLSDFKLVGQGGSSSDTGNDGIFITTLDAASVNNREWIIENVRCESFGGTGFYIDKCITPGNAWGRTGQLINLQATNCYRGFMFNTRGEYTQSTNLMAWANVRGIEVKAGNTKIFSSNFDHNGNGIILGGGTNNGHGQFVGCSSNHNSDFCLLIEGCTYGHVFEGCAFYTGEFKIKESAGIIFNGGLLAPNKITFENNTGTLLFNGMQVREDSVSNINKIGVSKYYFDNCVERNKGLSILNNYGCTALMLNRTADVTVSTSPYKISFTNRILEVVGGYDYTYKYATQQYTVSETGIYDICCSVDFECSTVNQRLEIIKNGAVIASEKLKDKTGGSNCIVRTLVKLEVGDIIYPQITFESGGNGKIKANDMTYFNVLLTQRIPVV